MKSRLMSHLFYLFFMVCFLSWYYIPKSEINFIWTFFLAGFPVYVIRRFTKRWPAYLLPLPAILFVAISLYIDYRHKDFHTVSYETKGKIDVTVLYDQYYDEPLCSNVDTLLFAWGYEFCRSDTADKYFFAFRYRDHDERHMNLLHLDSGSVKKEPDVYLDKKDYCIEVPIAESSARRYQETVSFNWAVTTRVIDDGCQDTHYSNVEIKTKKGKVRFRNLNNVRVYELDRFSRRNSLIVVSARLCRSEVIIYKIESREWEFDL